MADEMYDESEPSMAESASVANDTNDTEDNNKSDETEDQLALVPKHFFKDAPKPGEREMVEVIEVYEGEVSIKCVYGDKDDKEEEPQGDDEGAAVSEPEDEAYV